MIQSSLHRFYVVTGHHIVILLFSVIPIHRFHHVETCAASLGNSGFFKGNAVRSYDFVASISCEFEYKTFIRYCMNFVKKMLVRNGLTG